MQRNMTGTFQDTKLQDPETFEPTSVTSEGN